MARVGFRPRFRASALALCACALATFAFGCGDDHGMPAIDVDGGPFDGAASDGASGDAGRDLGADGSPADLAVCPDDDGDGRSSAACGGDDCDDADPARFPGATEVCDGDDEDCNDTTLGPDGDGDGDTASTCCNGAACGADCDDTRADVNPSATESCNAGVDDDCNGLADAADGVCVPCDAGYLGFDGDCVDVDECATAGFCGTGATGCANVMGSFVCSCGAGYAAASTVGGLCVNVDECAAPTNPCGAGSCTDNAGSYACTCDDGYRDEPGGAITCVDIDECASGMADCDTAPIATCLNTVGAYTCTCPAGYQGMGRGATGCADIDECALGTDDCDRDPAAMCTDTEGSFTCACPMGFTGSARGEDGCVFDDPSLLGLVVGSGASLSPAFAPGTVAYILTLPPAATTTTITPSVAFPSGATITVAGATVPSGVSNPVAANAGLEPRSVELVVTADSGATRTYTLTVVRSSLYVKASNTNAGDTFGQAVALSADGSTLAVGAAGEDSIATGIGGTESNNGAAGAGAVYVYRRNALGSWAQEAYVKASNTDPSDRFGTALALSADGATLAVGAISESSNATRVGVGDPLNDSLDGAGAVYVFRRTAGSGWAQQAYLKMDVATSKAQFGTSVALSSDGSRLAAGAPDANGGPGSVHLFQRSAGPVEAWTYQQRIDGTERQDEFGGAVALSGDGTTLAVGAAKESSSVPGIPGDPLDNGALASGATYVFRETGGSWAQESFIKASNAEAIDQFGTVLVLSEDGSTLAVAAPFEASSAQGVGGDESLNELYGSGAVYIFRREASTGWRQTAYVKASNTMEGMYFGQSVALSANGTTLLVGATGEASSSLGIGGSQVRDSYLEAGAAYLFTKGPTGGWTQRAYIKASNTDAGDLFGSAVAVSADGSTAAISAPCESSSATGIGGNQALNGATCAGAVYLF